MRYLIAVLLLLALLTPAIHASQRGDVVITGTVVIDENTVDPISGERGMYGISGNLTIEDNATLIVRNATLYFARGGNATMQVRGSLILENGTISGGRSNLTIQVLGNSSAEIRLENGTVTAYRLEAYYREIILVNTSIGPGENQASGIYLSHSILKSSGGIISGYPICVELYHSSLLGEALLENCTYGALMRDSSTVTNVTVSSADYGIYASAAFDLTVRDVIIMNSFVGIYSGYSSNFTVQDVAVNGSFHAVEVYRSAMTIRNITSDYGGIYAFDSVSLMSLRMENCTVSSMPVILVRNGTFTLSNVSEVLAYNASVHIRNVSSRASNFVIAVSSDVFADNVSLFPGDTGFLIRGGELAVWNSTVAQASYGIKAYGTNLSMVNTGISGSGFGAWIEDSSGYIDGSRFESSSFGLWIKGSQFSITNSSFVNDTSGLMLDGVVHSSVLNNTFLNCGVYLHADVDNVEESYLTNDLRGNVVNGKPLVFLKNASGMHVDYGGEVICVNCTGVVVENINVSNVDVGVSVLLSNNVTVNNVTTFGDWHGIYSTFSTGVRVLNSTSVNNSWAGIYFYSVSRAEVGGVKSSGNHIGFLACCLNDSLISRSEFSHNYRGFEWDRSHRDAVTKNIFRDNTEYAVFLDGCSDLRIWNNSFLWNHNSTTRFSPSAVQAYDNGRNAWNTSVGNFWLDWAGNNDSNDADGDGIVDYPYPLDGGARDYRPIKAQVPEFQEVIFLPLLLILALGCKVLYGRKA